MKVYVMRHGETDWNARHLFQGQVNTSLNEKGREQARKARERVRELGLSFDCVYSSPIDRAAQTIEIVTGLDRSQIHLDDRLKEMDFGPLDETPFEKDSPAAGHLFDKPSAYEAPEGAETFVELEARLSSFLQDLRKNHPGESILVGCHGCAMRILLVLLGYLPLDEIWNQGIGNCAIIELTLGEDDGFHVTQMYETQDWFGQR
ncbi:histidine phosphatase family protein [Bacillota bacterium LCP21S3_F9]